MSSSNPLLQPVEPGLPTPSADALAHSARVLAHVRTKIAQAPYAAISFADCMRELLYAPGLGYYAAGSTKFGLAGDFVTAPELSPFFGATLAQAFVPIWAMQGDVLELGAGSGKLAADFIAAAEFMAVDARGTLRYSILELSADLRARQGECLAGQPVSWLDVLPESIDGLVIANEVLDAVPCEWVRFQNGGYEQAFVCWRSSDTSAVEDLGRLDWQWRPLLKGDLLAAAKLRIPELEGYVSEINLEAEALVRTLASRLRDGVLCLIDYGFPRREYYLADRSGGTLACHYRQRVHFDPLCLTGLQDITAHVDFTAMAEAAVDGGAQVIAYSSQAQFLLAAGLLTRLEQIVFANERERVSALAAVQKLLSPSEMGELFKVLLLGKAGALDKLASFAAIDQSFRL